MNQKHRLELASLTEDVPGMVERGYVLLRHMSEKMEFAAKHEDPWSRMQEKHKQETSHREMLAY